MWWRGNVVWLFLRLNRRPLMTQAYLQSFVLFPPGDAASNLNRGAPAAENFSQNGHGSIKPPVLFNDPGEGE